MKSKAFADLDRLTSDKKLPVVQVLLLRREELRKQMVNALDKDLFARLQGAASEVDNLIAALSE